MTTPRPVIALFATEIKVTDWPGQVRWYVEVLGLGLIVGDDAHEYALLGAGANRLALKGGGPPDLPRDAVRLVFEVADLDAERDRLVRRDLAVSLPEESPEGYRASRLCDPEGTPITLFCWKTSERVSS
jgi:predicted enzyme related to lactoylglutathione lyase